MIPQQPQGQVSKPTPTPDYDAIAKQIRTAPPSSDYDKIAEDIRSTFNPPENVANRERPDNPFSQAVGTAMNVVGNAGESVTSQVFHPIDFLSSVAKMPVHVIQSHMQEGLNAYDAFQRGDRTEGTLRGLASIVPVFGPLMANYFSADQTGKEKIAGDVIGGLVVGAGAPVAAESAVSAAAKLSNKWRGSAVNSQASALGATGLDARASALELSPEMIRRGVRGTREQMLVESQSNLKTVGANMDAQIAKATQAGETISQADVRANLQSAINRMHTTDAQGQPIPIKGLEARIDQLRELDKFVGQLSKDIPVEQAKALKTVYGKIADEAGMYGQNASDVEKAKGWAASELQSALRRGLAKNASLAELDKEYGFWKGVSDILDPAVIKERTSSGPSILSRTGASMLAGSAAGGSAGYAFFGPGGATLGTVLGASGAKLIESPWWKTTVSAPMKNALADAIAARNYPRVTALTKSIIQTLPPNARSLFTTATGAATAASNYGVTGNTGRMGGPGGR